MNLFSFLNSKPNNNSSQASDSDLPTWQLDVSGRVQGVGFRWSVQTYAQELGLNGTVRNNPDSTVTIQLQASKKQVDNFIKNLPNKLSDFAQIKDIQIKKLAKVEKMHGFHVLY